MAQPEVDRIAALEAKVGSLRELLSELAQDKATLERALARERRRYEDLVERVPWLVARVDQRLHYSDVNRFYRELLGGQALLDRPVGSCGEGEALTSAITAFCADPVARRREVEVQITLPDGEHHFLLALSKSDFDRHVSVLGVDHSELHQALATAQAAAEQAREADRAKTEFLAVMSHEIRTPLTGILGMAELLLQGQLGADERATAVQINRSGEALLRVVNDILDLTKVESDRIIFESIAFSPAEIAGSIQGLYAQQARDKGVEVVAVVDGAVPPFVTGDPTRIGQILANLVSNAVKFTPSGTVSIHVGYRQARLRLAVQDTGVGLCPEGIERVFEPFVQGDRSTGRLFGGSGLGLAIVSKLVEAMGGEIGLESEVGVGTRVSVSVPAPAARAAVPDGSDDVEAGLLRAIAAVGPTVLVVDDHVVNQTIAKRMLESAGCEVRLAPDGLQALQEVQESDVDLVFMDVNMPVMDGLASVRAIRALQGACSAVPVVAMTANAIQGDRDACFEAGMDDYVGKPFRRLELLLAIERVVPLSLAS